MKEKIKENNRIRWREDLNKKIELGKIKKKVEREGRKIKKVVASWSRKIRASQNEIFITLLFLVGLVGIAFGAIDYQKTSELLKVAGGFTREEKYDEAIKKLELAQISWFVNNIGIKKQEINNQIEENKKLAEDKSSYDKGIDVLSNNNFQEAINILSTLPEDSFYYQKAQTKIEESKRMIVEGKLSKETTAKLAAQAKANQEELEKNIKAQQLSQKEAEEQRMKADNDNDGLTYAQELAAGTSDLTPDSDGDGIIDSLDSHPAGGGRLIAQHFEWDYRGKPWTWDYSFPSDWYDYYKNKKREPHGAIYVTYDDKYVKQIAEMLKKTADNNGYTKSDFAISFIQSLGYVGDDVIGYNDYPKYPLETIAEQNGDCEDTSYLAATIIDAMGIDCVLVELPGSPGHMAVAVAFSGSPSGYYYPLSNGRNYYYFETTGERFSVGDLPSEYRNVSASIVKIPSNESITVYPQYIKPCYASPDFSGYYYDSANYYSDSQCSYQITCLPYKEYYWDINKKNLYHDSGCSQIVTTGCYKSKSYPGYFYKSGSAWYYDSQCVQLYQSMICTYPYSYIYSCTSEYSYSSKKSTCDYYASSRYLSSMASSCYQELEKCRSDINEYQAKLNEYNQCYAKRE